jgi:hypothetical protein
MGSRARLWQVVDAPSRGRVPLLRIARDADV